VSRATRAVVLGRWPPCRHAIGWPLLRQGQVTGRTRDSGLAAFACRLRMVPTSYGEARRSAPETQRAKAGDSGLSTRGSRAYGRFSSARDNGGGWRDQYQ
jgi:hypothetical protein